MRGGNLGVFVMYAYIKGTLVHSTPSTAVIEANGIGYQLHIPSRTYSQLPQAGAHLILYTSFIVREQSQALYGFTTVQERDFFEQLLGVTGIGPKTALSLVGHMALVELQQAIVQGDATSICRVPGIGKKGAERLIIEMRDKVGALGVLPTDLAVHVVGDKRSQDVMDAISALINLGYNQGVAQKAIKKTLKEVPEEVDLASLISGALKNV